MEPFLSSAVKELKLSLAKDQRLRDLFSHLVKNTKDYEDLGLGTRDIPCVIQNSDSYDQIEHDRIISVRADVDTYTKTAEMDWHTDSLRASHRLFRDHARFLMQLHHEAPWLFNALVGRYEDRESTVRVVFLAVVCAFPKEDFLRSTAPEGKSFSPAFIKTVICLLDEIEIKSNKNIEPLCGPEVFPNSEALPIEYLNYSLQATEPNLPYQQWIRKRGSLVRELSKFPARLLGR